MQSPDWLPFVLWHNVFDLKICNPRDEKCHAFYLMSLEFGQRPGVFKHCSQTLNSCCFRPVGHSRYLVVVHQHHLPLLHLHQLVVLGHHCLVALALAEEQHFHLPRQEMLHQQLQDQHQAFHSGRWSQQQVVTEVLQREAVLITRVRAAEGRSTNDGKSSREKEY